MKNKKQARNDIIKIFCSIKNLDYVMRDKRKEKVGLVFGKIKDVASQLGIKTEKSDNGYFFVAPKSRMQMFVEKLHFACIPFTEWKE